jgi:hypothetical protein
MSKDILGQVLFEVRVERGNPNDICSELIKDFMAVVEDRKTRNPLGWRDSVDASRDTIMFEIAAKHGLSLEISNPDHYVFVERPWDGWAGWN